MRKQILSNKIANKTVKRSRPLSTEKKIKFLITAGPTREYLDPVRFISNNSSGKMGYFIAEAARRCGAEVILVSGPVALQPPKKVKIVKVVSAGQMLSQVKKYFAGADVFISCSAVSDFKPKNFSREKIKSGKPISITLVPTPDILGENAGRGKPFVVGFALENRKKLMRDAAEKLSNKNCDMLVANPTETMESDFSQATIFYKNGKVRRLNKMSKKILARRIVREILSTLRPRDNKKK